MRPWHTLSSNSIQCLAARGHPARSGPERTGALAVADTPLRPGTLRPGRPRATLNTYTPVGVPEIAFLSNVHMKFLQEIRRPFSISSVSARALEEVADYIARQEEHHRKVTFEDELKTRLENHGIQYDLKYLL